MAHSKTYTPGRLGAKWSIATLWWVWVASVTERRVWPALAQVNQLLIRRFPTGSDVSAPLATRPASRASRPPHRSPPHQSGVLTAPPNPHAAPGYATALHTPTPMNGILDLLADRIGGDNIGQIAGAIGADRGQTQTAVAAALPAILTALNRNTNSTQGAQGLATALERDHDGSLLDHLGGFLGGQLQGKQADGGGILGHVLGGQRPQVEQGVAQASGLDMGQVAKLLPILAPIVMAALGRQKRQSNLDAGGLSGMLGQEAQRARRAAPDGILGSLSGFLDKDGDGSIQDDIAGQVGRAALGKLFGR